MSLATRCTACGTIFRVVEDQLRVSDGWVRCGRCAEIFDAREMLFDIERDAPPPWPPQYAPVAAPPEPLPPPPPPPPPAPEPAQVMYSPSPDWMPPPDPEPQADVMPTGWPAEPGRHEPRWMDDGAPAPSAPPEPAPSIFDDDADPVLPPPVMAAEPAKKPGKPASPAAAQLPVPEFMRRAESSARWNSPRVRLAMGLGAGLLAVLLALQITLHFRDALAALHPPMRGLLSGLCSLSGCEVKPWRRIEALSIDATSLNPVGSGGSYKLSLSLRNKTGVDVAAPWVELSLTDAAGAPMARRVLAPDALSPALTQVNAESEQALSLLFSTGGQRVSGYSVNIFYP